MRRPVPREVKQFTTETQMLRDLWLRLDRIGASGTLMCVAAPSLSAVPAVSSSPAFLVPAASAPIVPSVDPTEAPVSPANTL